MTTKTATKQMEQALADDLERVASSSDSIELRVTILNGDDFALSLPRDAPVSELRARVAQAMEAKSTSRVRLFHADGGEAELTQGDARALRSCGDGALPARPPALFPRSIPAVRCLDPTNKTKFA